MPKPKSQLTIRELKFARIRRNLMGRRENILGRTIITVPIAIPALIPDIPEVPENLNVVLVD